MRARSSDRAVFDVAPSTGIHRVVGSPVSEEESRSGAIFELSPRDVVRQKSTSMETLKSGGPREASGEQGVVNGIGQRAAAVRRRLARHLESMEPGEVATVVCDDPDIPVGIQDWSLTMGFDVESLFTDELGNWTVKVRRKGAMLRNTARSTPRDGISAESLLASSVEPVSPDRPLESDAPRRTSDDAQVPYSVFAQSPEELTTSLRNVPKTATYISVRATGDASAKVLLTWCLDAGHRLTRYERSGEQFVATLARVDEGLR